jgi:hypothetical protein
MDSLPNFPDNSTDQFQQMMRSACKVCDHILAIEPDLVLVLMHSGWGSVFAAQVLWRCTQSTPFPPIVKTNIGREKVDEFDNRYNMHTSRYFLGKYADAIEIGLYLAWIQDKTLWHEQLRQQVTDILGPSLKLNRILIVDDRIQNGTTWILTLELLKIVFPQANAFFLNANSWYQSNYAELMFKIFPQLISLFPDSKIPSDEIKNQLYRVAIGTEDVSAESLYWQPISAESTAIQELKKYGEAFEWAAVSKTIYAMIDVYVTELSASYEPESIEIEEDETKMCSSYYIMRDIWINGSVTRREIKSRYGLSEREIDHYLGISRRYGEILLDGYGRGANYKIPPAIRRYMEGLGERPDRDNFTFWLLPRKLLFGEVPYRSEDLEINAWLNVEIIRKGEKRNEETSFLNAAKESGIHVSSMEIIHPNEYIDENDIFSIRRGRLKRSKIVPILNQIDFLLDNGYILYVSVADIDILGIIAGCYLARHGQTGRSVLKTLQACRADSSYGWKPMPATREARRYVREWPKGL